MNHPDDLEHDLDMAREAARARGHMHRAVDGAAVPGDPWARVSRRVTARRRRRTATVAGTSTLAVSAVAALVLGGGLTGLSATSARMVGPAGYPESTATTTLAPTDEQFAYYADAETFPDLLAGGPDQETLVLLEEAENLLVRDCVRAGGSDYPTLDRQAAFDAEADERLVQQRALQRRADAFGDPAHAADHGYGIDMEEWSRVVVNGAGGDAGRAGGTPDVDLEQLSTLLSGPDSAYIEIGGGLEVPGAGCLFEAQSELWGDYVQAVRSQQKVLDSMHPENLRGLASHYDPQLRAADVVWSSCMAQKGWRGLDDQTQAFSLVWNDYWGLGRDDAAQVERDIAVADAQCVVDTGYADVLAAAEARLVDHLTNDPDVIAYGALVEDAVPRAEAVVQAEAERVEAARPLTADEVQGLADSRAELARLEDQARYLECMAQRGYVLSSQDEVDRFTGPDGAEVTVDGNEADSPDAGAAHDGCRQP